MNNLIFVPNIKFRLNYSRFDYIKQTHFLIIFSLYLNNIDPISSYITITSYFTKKIFFRNVILWELNVYTLIRTLRIWLIRIIQDDPQYLITIIVVLN